MAFVSLTAVNGSGLLPCLHCREFLFAPIQCDQLAEAAKDGRADDIFALIAEGADIEWKDLQARNRFRFVFDALIS
jgi:hypothetical protein